MAPRLKFYGWGHEGEGLDEAERARVFRFVAEKLGAEQSAAASPPQVTDIALRAPALLSACVARFHSDARPARTAAPHLRQVLP